MSKITTVASTVPVVTEEGSADSAKWRFTGGFLAFSVLSGAAFYMTMPMSRRRCGTSTDIVM